MLSDRESLRPSLGLRDALVLDLGAIIGARVFVVIGILAGLAGPALVVSILIAAVVASVSPAAAALLNASDSVSRP